MELIFDVVIRNIPDVKKSRDLLLSRLRDRGEEEGLSDIILCMVTAGQDGRSGTGFASFRDLTHNDRMVEWSVMVFYGSRLEFVPNRWAEISWRNVEGRWNRTHREPKPEAEQDSKPEGEPARESVRKPAKESESEPENDYAALFREDSWDAK